MAGALGSLNVTLGLDASEFTRGMSKSEYEAKKFADRLERGIASGAAKVTLAFGAMAAGAATALAAFSRMTEGAAKFKDLEETTGASAESIASLAVSAATAGVQIEDVASSMNKLTKNLVGVDDEGKAAGAALEAIGLNIAEFKKLDPAAQYQAIGKALSGFADGPAKVAVVMATFGKAGAEQLKVFKALEEAGGAQVILTKQMIERADEYTDKQAKARAELSLMAQAAATEALPALTDLTRAGSEFIRTLIGIDGATKEISANNAVAQFADAATKALAFVVDSGQGVVRIFQLIGREIALELSVIKTLKNEGVLAAQALAKSGRQDMQDAFTAPLFSQQLEAAKAARLAAGPPAPVGNKKPEIKFSGAVKGAGVGAGDKRWSGLTYSEEVSQAIGRMADDSDVVRIAKVNDQLERLNQLAAQGFDPAIVSDVRAKLYAQLPRDLESSAEAFRRMEIAGTDATNKALAADKVQEYIDEQKRLADLLSGTSAVVLEEQRADMMRLTKAYEEGRITVDQYSEAVTKRLGVVADKVDGFYERFAENAQRHLGQGFYDMMTGRFSDIGRGFGDMVTRMIADAAAADLARRLFGDMKGGASSDGGWISSIGKMLSAWGSGSSGPDLSLPNTGQRANGGPVLPGGMYEVAEKRPEMLDVGGRKFLLMGNQRGNVTPNPSLGGGGSMISAPITINVPDGTSRQTANQIGAAVAIRLRRAAALSA